MAVKQRYSRLANVEVKKARRSLFIYTALTIGMVIIIFLYGIGFLSRFADLINSLAGGNKPISIGDNTPPAPPRVDSFPEYTKDKSFSLKGSAESGAIVSITFNSDKDEVVADADGKFSYNFTLSEGENVFSLLTVDGAGNKSVNTKTYTIIYDKTAPEITLSQPENNKTFYGSGEQTITIEGETEPKSTLTINDRVVVLGNSGAFRQDFRLEPGENTLTLKVTDPAGNESETTLTLSYNP